VVVVDVSPGNQRGITIARRLEATAHGPHIVLTSSADRDQFDSRLDGYQFVAKADICSDALTNPGRPRQTPSTPGGARNPPRIE
jgi:hypothetical protein